MHRLTLAVHYPTVSQNGLIGSNGGFSSTNCGKQRGLEPTSVLVCALQIEICGPLVILVVVQYCKVRGSGVEPAVQGVGLLGEMLAAAMRTNKGIGQKLCSLLFVPNVRAMLAKRLGYDVNGLIGANGLLALLAVEHGNGQTPMALTGDTPVGSISHHLLDAFSSPIGKPLNVLASLDRIILKRLHRAEPLR